METATTIDPNATRERIRTLLAQRPDLTIGMLASYTEHHKDSARHFVQQNKPSLLVAQALERVLDRIAAGDILQPGGSTVIHCTEPARPRRPERKSRSFYATATVRSIVEVLNYCAREAKIGIVTAEFGVGKTESLRYWRDTDGKELDHFVFEFDEFTARCANDFVWVLGSRLSLPVKTGLMHGGHNFRLVQEYFVAHPTLLILDQCENVQARTCQIIRQWWDSAKHNGMGVTMLAAPLLLQRLKKGNGGDLGALSSRVGVWAPLRGIQKDEVAEILKQEGITQVADDAFLLLHRSCNGSMRRLMAVVDLLKAKHQGKPVSTRTIEGVAGNLWGLDLLARSNS